MTDKELMEQFQMLMGAIDRVDKKVDTVDKKVDTFKKELSEKIEASETRMMVYIENTVTKKIESLFDGYKLVHEKQWEMERRLDKLERVVEELQNRTA